VLWIVDLNRQSLDRVVPDIAYGRWAGMFEAAGWQVLTVKYGRRLEALFERPGGDALRARIDAMGNEEFQRLLRADANELRERLPGTGRGSKALGRLVAELDDGELRAALRDLGGHDLARLTDAVRTADDDRPTVVFAYTVKGWGLPIEGHPSNHSALLSDAQFEQLAAAHGVDAAHPWAGFAPDSAEGKLCRQAAERLERPQPDAAPAVVVPRDVGREHRGTASTQQALGRFFTDLAHTAPQTAQRVVTVSPDVASSTNLGGWINRAGIWAVADRHDWFADDTDTLVRWRETSAGQHIELGIAETNLVGLAAELGATWSRLAQPLLPIATLYDPFVGRALEPWSFGMYAGGQSILIGTPSGITLAPEGGAHQSTVTPSVGIAQPGCVAFEPAFGADLEWCLLWALNRLGKPDGGSAYLRLSTRPIDQELASVPTDPAAREARRRAALAGGYRLRSPAQAQITLVGMGAVMPEVLAAADELDAAGVPAAVICLTSADLVFRASQARAGLTDDGDPALLDSLFPPGRRTPLVTVLDGHPSALAFLAGAWDGTRSTHLGVHGFGQSGALEDLYRVNGLDVDTIVGAAGDLL
jgi:pyruvate dehydrogenase E1 component